MNERLTVHRFRRPGQSLIEIGLIMVIVSLALAPLVQMVGGQQGNQGQGSATRINAQRSKETMAANTLVERVLAANPANVPALVNCPAPHATVQAGQAWPSNTTVGPRAMSICRDDSYNQSIYYQWIVENMTETNGAIMPKGNEYYRATLNVYDQDPSGGGVNPVVTFPTSFYRNVAGYNDDKPKTGVIVVLDISGSMLLAKDNYPGGVVGDGGVGSPYLKYRYADTGYTPDPAIALNINDDAQLDITALDRNTDDPNTPYDDRYLNNNASIAVAGSDCDSTSWVSSAPYSTDPNRTGGPNWEKLYAFDDPSDRNAINSLCNMPPGQENNILNAHMSRIEAARSSLLKFMLTFEQSTNLYENVRLGLVTFSSGNQVRSNMEAANGQGKYPRLRRQLTRINRYTPNGLGIMAGGGTQMHHAIVRAVNVLNADPSSQNRIIFVVGDGEPNGSCWQTSNFRNLATALRNKTGYSCGGASFGPPPDDNDTTIFTLGVVRDINAMRPWMKDSLADITPGGAFFHANSVADMDTVFEQINYQIARFVLINRANRYGIDLN